MEEELKEIKELALNNAKAIEQHNSKFEEQNEKILANFEKATNNSMAIDILRDFKDEIKTLHNEKERQYDTIKRLMKILVIFGILWAVTVGYLVYVLNDIGVEETTTESYDITQEIDGVNDINGNIVNRGK